MSKMMEIQVLPVDTAAHLVERLYVVQLAWVRILAISDF